MELKAQDGSRLFVNPDAIWHIRSNGADQTAVYGLSGAALFVHGSVDEVADQLAKWKRAERSRSADARGEVISRPEGSE